MSETSSKEFTRSAGGVANYHLFLNTENVVFCEGQPASVGFSDPAETLDLVWWKLVLEQRIGLSNFRLYPCGAKSQVLANVRLAAKAEENESSVPRTYGCVDRDYDDFTSADIESSIRERLFVTEGYEVENDLLLVLGIREIMKFFTPRLSKKDQMRGEQCLSRLSRSLGFIRIIDTEFQARNIIFLSTTGIPSFVEQLQSLGGECRADVSQRFLAFKRKTLSNRGFSSFSELMALPRKGNKYVSRKVDGFLLCPGEMVIKSLAHVLNLFGKRVSGWTKQSYDRLIEVMLGLLSLSAARLLSHHRTTTLRSWASI